MAAGLWADREDLPDFSRLRKEVDTIERNNMAMERWLIDTDILVDNLRGIPQALEFLEM